MSLESNNANQLLDFAGHAFPVEGLGPGRRVAIWVRGCPLACPGCMTPELWTGRDSSTHTPVECVADLLLPLLRHADGLTISGGEPMEQPGALAHLVRVLRSELPDLEVLVYSGYGLEDLQSRDTARDFLGEIDLLIDRPFAHNAPNTLQWRGSDNQRVHILSPRAQRHALNKDLPMPERRPLQVQPLETGRYRIIGIPRRGDFVAYRTAMAQRGLIVEPEVEAPSTQKNIPHSNRQSDDTFL